MNGTYSYLHSVFLINRFALTRITTFNKRRGQEVARMTLRQYHKRVKGSSGASLSNIKMSKLETEIAKFTEVVTVKGSDCQTVVWVFGKVDIEQNFQFCR